MVIDLTNLFNGADEVVPVDYTYHISDLIFDTYNPLKEPVQVSGRFYQEAGVVQCDLNVHFAFDGYCDRCAEAVHKSYEFPVQKVFVPRLDNNDDFEDYIVVSNASVDLDAFVREEILLFLPSKILCKDDCKGLCPKCGKNLNEGSCDCKKDIDPRMEALLQLLDEE